MFPSGNFLDKLNSSCLILPRRETFKSGCLSATPLPRTSHLSTLECGTYGACGRWESWGTQSPLCLFWNCFVCSETVWIKLVSQQRCHDLWEQIHLGVDPQNTWIKQFGLQKPEESKPHLFSCTNRYLWWLILCINLTRSWYPGTCSNIILDVPVKVFFRWSQHLSL